jgi:hypothetical protein
MKTYYEDFNKFIEENSFEDNTGAYNCKLIEVNDIKNFWKHYTNNINASLNNIYECFNIIQRNLEDIEDMVE